MARRGKLLQRLQQRPRNFTWDELVRMLRGLGYTEAKPGKTGGSRRRFVHPSYPVISLHKPHPGNTLKVYQINQIIQMLRQEGLI